MYRQMRTAASCLILASLFLNTAANASSQDNSSNWGSADTRDWKHFNPSKFRYQERLVPDYSILPSQASIYYSAVSAFPHDPTKSSLIFGRGSSELPTEIYTRAFDILQLGNKYYQAPAAGQQKHIVVNGKGIAIYGTTVYTPLADLRFAANPVRVIPFNPHNIFYKDKDIWPAAIYGNPGEEVIVAGQRFRFPEAGQKLVLTFGADGKVKNFEKPATASESDTGEESSSESGDATSASGTNTSSGSAAGQGAKGGSSQSGEDKAAAGKVAADKAAADKAAAEKAAAEKAAAEKAAAEKVAAEKVAAEKAAADKAAADKAATEKAAAEKVAAEKAVAEKVAAEKAAAEKAAAEKAAAEKAAAEKAAAEKVAAEKAAVEKAAAEKVAAEKAAAEKAAAEKVAAEKVAAEKVAAEKAAAEKVAAEKVAAETAAAEKVAAEKVAAETAAAEKVAAEKVAAEKVAAETAAFTQQSSSAASPSGSTLAQNMPPVNLNNVPPQTVGAPNSTGSSVSSGITTQQIINAGINAGIGVLQSAATSIMNSTPTTDVQVIDSEARTPTTPSDEALARQAGTDVYHLLAVMVNRAFPAPQITAEEEARLKRQMDIMRGSPSTSPCVESFEKCLQKIKSAMENYKIAAEDRKAKDELLIGNQKIQEARDLLYEGAQCLRSEVIKTLPEKESDKILNEDIKRIYPPGPTEIKGHSGERFKTREDALRSWRNDVLSTSLQTHREYAGILYQRTEDKTWSYTPQYRGTPSSSRPEIAETVGDLPSPSYEVSDKQEMHTHGGKDPGYDSYKFSPEDIESAEKSKNTSIMLDPSGVIHEYIPSKTTLIGGKTIPAKLSPPILTSGK